MRAPLGEHASSKEGRMVWQNCQNFMTLQKSLYLHSMPKGEKEDLLLFVVPKVHWVVVLKAHQVATLNGCH